MSSLSTEFASTSIPLTFSEMILRPPPTRYPVELLP